MELNGFDGFIFDLDGTLIDSANVWHDIDSIFFARRGLTLPEDYARRVSAMDFYEAAVYTKELAGLSETPEEMIAEWGELAYYEYEQKIKPIPFAGEFLKRLRSAGKRMALATASNERLYTAVLTSNGMYEYFDCFVTTAEVSRGKEHPDIYVLAAEKLGLPTEKCAVFEDQLSCIRAARRGGFAAAACLYSAFPDDIGALRSESDLSFSDYSELLEMI